jgi:hypothetical protein
MTPVNSLKSALNKAYFKYKNQRKKPVFYKKGTFSHKKSSKIPARTPFFEQIN